MAVAAGMEVGQQVWQHIDYPQAGDAAYAAQLSSAISVMRGMGYAHYIQSMPYNDITRSQVNIAAGMGVKLLREARQTITPILPWGLGAGSINVGQFGTDNKTLADLKLAVDAAVRYGGLLTTTTHQLVAGGNGTATTGSSTQTFVNDFSAMVDYALAQGVTIVTGGQLLDSLAALKAQSRYG